MSWYATKKASKLPAMDKSKILVFDVETTGIFDRIDEIIQITILDGYGNQLYSSYIKPTRKKKWSRAQRVNGISFSMVEDAPTFKNEKKKIQEIFNNAKLIVGYNVGFDIRFVEANGIIVAGTRFDVMTAFSSFRAAIEHSGYKKYKLLECAEYFGYSFKPHDTTEDAKATLYCFDKLISDERFITYKPKGSNQIEGVQRRINKKKLSVAPLLRIILSYSLIRYMIIILCGTVILSILSGVIPKDCNSVREVFQFVKNALFREPLVTIVAIVTMLSLVKCFLFVIRKIFRIPKWVIIHIQRLFKMF